MLLLRAKINLRETNKTKTLRVHTSVRRVQLQTHSYITTNSTT